MSNVDFFMELYMDDAIFCINYSPLPKKQVILGILGQINKKVKMTMFAPIYYPYLVLIDSYMCMHFLNRVI